MKIELRKIAYQQRLSEETPCYSAELWADGAKIAVVRNRGHGGCDEVSPVRGKSTAADIARVEAFIKATYPSTTTEFIVKGEPMILPPTLESVCHDLLDAHLREGDLRRALKNKILFQKAGSDDLFEVSARGLAPADRIRLLSIVREQHQPSRILNEMPFADALVIYSKGAR